MKIHFPSVAVITLQDVKPSITHGDLMFIIGLFVVVFKYPITYINLLELPTNCLHYVLSFKPSETIK